MNVDIVKTALKKITRSEKVLKLSLFNKKLILNET